MRLSLGCLSVISALLLGSGGASAQEPGRSFDRLVTSNGWAVASYDRATRKLDTFLEHPYRFREPRNDPPDLCFEADESRDLMFDMYFGVRVDGAGTWMNDAALDDAGYVPGTGVIHAVQHAGPDRQVEVETYSFLPMDVDQPALIVVADVENVSSTPVTVSTYAVMNFRLGDAGGGRDPGADGEEVSWDAARSTFYEYGPGEGTIAYSYLGTPYRTTTSAGAAGVYQSLLDGRDLDDSRSTSGPRTDVAPGFQSAPVTLAPGQRDTVAIAIIWALDEDAGPDVDVVRTWSDGRSGIELVSAEQTQWQAWHTEPPAGLSEEQQALWRQSAAILRMGQVREAGPGFGQILASMPPGLGFVDAQWNIAWVRDMAYAVAGLARSGHLQEAHDAIAFQVNAPRGRHETEVGMPYRISVTRYFGNGQEESDCNADGPNIEFDGFGLFLWSLGEYLRAGGDATPVAAWWPTIRDEIADVLVALVDDSGVISADSSIWEVHWNGKQRRFTYTSLAAVRGLCEAAELADQQGDSDAAGRYRDTALSIRRALIERHTDRRGALGQSAEDVLMGHSYVDAATVEAINWGIVDPNGVVAAATLDSLLDNLTVQTGYGLMRNDDGGWYDSQEWVFVDLRLLPALRAAGRTQRADQLTGWLQGQALSNDLMFSELHEAERGGYAGSIPMVGFGAGAYIVALSGAGVADAACGSYAEEPDVMRPDAGAPTTDAGTCIDCTPPPPDDGCGCATPGGRSAPSAWPLLALPLLLIGYRR